MSDTINSMKLVPADLLKPDQLMEGDLIKIGEDIVEVIEISSDGAADNWFIETKDPNDHYNVTVSLMVILKVKKL